MTPHEFIATWKPVTLSERSACQQHFLALCELLGQPKPAEVDPHGEWYTFEKGAVKEEGDKGWADVWLQGKFGWEYKGKHKDLKAAYKQLLQYREALENPPLLVVCDMDRFEVHTNFTGTAKKVYGFDLDGLADPQNLLVLRNVFSNPDALKPGKTRKAITEELASDFALLAESMQKRGVGPDRAAHFLMKLIFCMFAEDIEMLPRDLFTRTVGNSQRNPAQLSELLKGLFRSMAQGKPFGADPILRFNGGLFADEETIDLLPEEIDDLHRAAQADWSSVEPSIFGTLFERLLDPTKRSQIGAHYTSREDIETIVRPVVLAPLQREWQEVRERAEKAWLKVKAAAAKTSASSRKRDVAWTRTPGWRQFSRILEEFAERLTHVTILDPACGSGNFLYVAINLLLELEKEVLTFAADHHLALIPLVRPTQLLGLEINEYAYQLAQVVAWIGYLQWKMFNGYQAPSDPVLDPIDTIRHTDAILDGTGPVSASEPDWPEAEFIVGNPPFLGGKKLRSELTDTYVDDLFRVWAQRVRAEADLCCYWFEKAPAMIEAGKCRRAGLLATQGIRGGANRDTLKRIKESGNIFFAESDRDWILEGAAVHVSMVGFDGGSETELGLDGKPVSAINSDLTAGVDVTKARRLAANRNISYMGDTKGGWFDIPEETALAMLNEPNPDGRPNSDVVIPWINGLDVTRRNRRMWIIDFGTNLKEGDAALYEAPFEFVHKHTRPQREVTQRATYRQCWWLHVRPRDDMRKSLKPLARFIATTTVSKHRLFVWEAAPTLPDHQLITFALAEDYDFGLLQSLIHAVWALELGTQLETRPRYTPTTCFETFPMPDASADQRATVAAAAVTLAKLRDNWLNPPEWTNSEVLTFRGSVAGPWARYVTDPDAQGIGTVHYPRLIPKDEQSARQLASRTLTNLYNARPTWLLNAHRQLDEAVFAAYGWPSSLTDEEILGRLLELNLTRSGAASGAAPLVDPGADEADDADDE
jgi:type II restriction/modification system DNA methylase subunit YeeA